MTSPEHEIKDFGMDVFSTLGRGVDYNDGDIAIISDIERVSHVGPARGNMYTLVTCGGGHLAVLVAGSRYDLGQGDVLFCVPGAIVEVLERSDDLRGAVLCITNRLVMGMLGGSISVWSRVLYVDGKVLYHIGGESVDGLLLYAGIMERKLSEASQPYQREIVQSILRAILFEMCRFMVAGTRPSGDYRVCQAKVIFGKFIDKLASERMKKRPVYYYADALYITPKYLTVVCKEVSGKTASDWIEEYLAEDISFYLRNTSKSMKEICEILNFPNVSFFGKYVRQHFGMTPTDYRNSV